MEDSLETSSQSGRDDPTTGEWMGLTRGGEVGGRLVPLTRSAEGVGPGGGARGAIVAFFCRVFFFQLMSNRR